MRLGHFTMPPNPPHRDPLKTLQEDREAVFLADRLGFHDAFIGEYLTDRCENVTGSHIDALGILSEDRSWIFAEAIGESIRLRDVAERT